MSMWRRSISLLFVLSVFAVAGGENEEYPWLTNPFKKKGLDVTVIKTGPYFGLQRGKYTILELGVERQWKNIKLKTAKTQALHMGFNYNFKYNVLGYDIGYWNKPSRIGLTYGGNLVMRTDFDETRIGIAPVLGYKLYGFHLQTGYHFLTPATDFIETNRFFVSLRFVWINDREVDFDRNKKNKKKKDDKDPWYKRG